MVPSTSSPRLTGLACAVLAALACFNTHANPTGGTVVSGAAAISASGNSLVVNQSSNRAVVNWQSFSINPGQATRFNLPGSSAAILNRVITNTPSAIYGSLSSNGQVFLINPSGIVVGPTGVISVGHLGLSTRDVSNPQFMAGGDLQFSGSSGASVVNLGTITATAGDALIIAARVENGGVVNAPHGVVAFVAGNEVLYAPDANSRIVVRSGVDAAGAATGVDNSGVIRAAQVELRSAGGNPYALAINHSGVISAVKVDSIGGRVILSGGAGVTNVSGAITATAADRTNEIQVLGGSVTLAPTAAVDASGPEGGGKVLVGGGYQGKDSGIPNALTTTVEKGATLRADATSYGDGGQVVVWADGKTTYEGAISARGAASGGNGGVAEVSGKAVLAFRGTADLQAPRGRTGPLLLDPTDITIGVGGTSTASCTAGNCTGSGTGSFLELATLEAALATANVTVSTTSSGGGAGDITIASTMAGSTVGARHDLTLTADRDILVNGPFNVFHPVSGGLGTPILTMLAGRNITVAPGVRDFNGFAIVGEAGLTLVAARTIGTGAISIGAGSNIGSTFEYTSGALSGGPVRVFGASAAQTTLTGWTQAGSVPVTQDKGFGDAGTSATGIYYKPTPTPVTVIDTTNTTNTTNTTTTTGTTTGTTGTTGTIGTTTGTIGTNTNTNTNTTNTTNTTQTGSQTTSQQTVLIVQWVTPPAELPDPFDGALKVVAQMRWEGTEFGAANAPLAFFKGIAIAFKEPGESDTVAYARALAGYMKEIEAKNPSDRTADEQMIYARVTAGMLWVVSLQKMIDVSRAREAQRAVDRIDANLAALETEREVLTQQRDGLRSTSPGLLQLFDSGGNDTGLYLENLIRDKTNEILKATLDRVAAVDKAREAKSVIYGAPTFKVDNYSSADATALITTYIGLSYTLAAQ